MKPARLLALSFILVFAASATAEARVNAHAARVRHLKARVAAVLPAAQSQVQAAAGQGPAALQALVQKVEAMPLAAPGTTSVTQYALLQALQPYATTSEDSGFSSDVLNAHASAACWYLGNHVYDRVNFYVAGVKVGWAEKDHGYWCGNGTSITDVGGANLGYYHTTWVPSLTPYCIVLPFNQNGWDAPNHGWAHGGLVAHEGNYTPWTSCVTFLGDHAIVRIAANGYKDYYWDF